MRAAFLVSDVLEAVEDPAAVVRRLEQAGLCVAILAPDREALPERSAGLSSVVLLGAEGRPGCWSDGDGLLSRAAARCDVPLGDAFFVCREADDLTFAAEAGCRPVLVLCGRSLDEVFGPAEPPQKEAAGAPDLETAVRYVLEETNQEAAVGPFPYAERVSVEGHVQTLVPSGRDLAAVFALVMLAGLAIALGIAYLLQEVYQRASLPDVFYYLTLQFIPQTWRGVLFLVIGTAAGLLVRPYLSRLTGRYLTRRS